MDKEKEPVRNVSLASLSVSGKLDTASERCCLPAAGEKNDSHIAARNRLWNKLYLINKGSHWIIICFSPWSIFKGENITLHKY